MLPADGGAQQLRIADADLIPGSDGSDGEDLHQESVSVVVDVLLCSGATVVRHHGSEGVDNSELAAWHTTQLERANL